MKNKLSRKILAILVIGALLATAFSLCVSGQTEASGLSFGTQVGEYNGVIAYSNWKNDYASGE